MSLVFRLVEASGGATLIDGVDTSHVGLTKLRQSISIIPQDPILMAGSVRYNLDPFGLKSEPELVSALLKAHLSPAVLDESVTDSGGNLSAGQRQLLCFARALLFPAQVVIMDEPTASCDLETDELVQAMVREEFQGVTVLTIAHRLETVIDSDKVLVLGDGEVLEYGSPTELLSLPSGPFAAMCAALGPAAEEHLKARAAHAHASATSTTPQM
jgi:ABC-type multidrug transport system fused ATPase/permease subunit